MAYMKSDAAQPLFAGTRPASKALRVSYQAVGGIMGAAESIVITLGSVLGREGYEQVAHVHGGDVTVALGLGILASLIYGSVACVGGLYALPTLISPGRHLSRILGACALVLLALSMVLFLLKVGSDVSRGVFVGLAAAMLFFCTMTRIAAAGFLTRMLENSAILGRPVFLIGESDELASLTPSLLLRQYGRREVGRIVLPEHDEADGGALVQKAYEAVELARLLGPDEIMVAAKGTSVSTITEVKQALRTSPLPVRLLPNQVFRSLIEGHTQARDGNAYLIELQRAPMSLAERAIKRCFDIVVASFAIMALVPVMVFAAAAVRLDSSGPIIFRQRRNGFNQRLFVIFKFRTMSVLEDGGEVVQARRGDRRVTRVGAILRRTSIDELPQLFNVLKGDMSLVGPRPHALAHDTMYKALIGDYCMRHHVKPGITGWAQVQGFRGETAQTEDMRRRIECDVWYVNNWSLLLDFQIVVKTAFQVLKVDAY